MPHKASDSEFASPADNVRGLAENLREMAQALEDAADATDGGEVTVEELELFVYVNSKELAMTCILNYLDIEERVRMRRARMN